MDRCRGRDLTLGCGVGTGAGLKRSAAGFKVVSDRAHTAVDADVAADVECELGVP